MSNYRVGVLGLTHDHLWSNLKDLAESSRGELAAAADPNGPLLDKIRGEYNCSKVFEDPDRMLKETDLDAVYIYGDNAASVDLVEKAAARGIPAMVEKPMAASLAEADRMLAAARRAGVVLMINWPFAWIPQLRKALAMIRSGEIGTILSVRYRAAHAGPMEIGCSPYFYGWLYDKKRNGAGALMDYCCYGAVLARDVLGQPSRVTAAKGRLQKEYMAMEDNAVIVMQWPRAMAVTEGSWIQVGHLSAYTSFFYGTDGTLMVDQMASTLRLATTANPDGVEVEVPEPPPEERNATEYFLSRLEKKLPVEGLCDPRVSRDAQEILEAGLISAGSGQAVSLPLPLPRG